MKGLVNLIHLFKEPTLGFNDYLHSSFYFAIFCLGALLSLSAYRLGIGFVFIFLKPRGTPLNYLVEASLL